MKFESTRCFSFYARKALQYLCHAKVHPHFVIAIVIFTVLFIEFAMPGFSIEPFSLAPLGSSGYPLKNESTI